MTWCFVIWYTRQLKSVHWLQSNPDWRVFLSKTLLLVDNFINLLFHYYHNVILPSIGKVMRTCKMCYDITLLEQGTNTEQQNGHYEHPKFWFFFPFLGYFWKKQLLSTADFFVGHKQHLVNGSVFVNLVFCIFLMQSIQCTARPLECVLRTKSEQQEMK